MPFAKQMSNNNLNANVLRSKIVIVKVLRVPLYTFGTGAPHPFSSSILHYFLTPFKMVGCDKMKNHFVTAL